MEEFSGLFQGKMEGLRSLELFGVGSKSWISSGSLHVAIEVGIYYWTFLEVWANITILGYCICTY